MKRNAISYFMRGILGSLMLAYYLAAPCAWAAEWPMFQLDVSHTANNTEDIIRFPLGDSWRVGSGADSYSFSSPIQTNSAVYTAFSNGTLSAFDKLTGTQLWSVAIDGVVHSAPLYYNGIVYFATSDGTIYAFRASDGGLVWANTVRTAINTSPVAKDNYLYFVSNSGILYSLTADTGDSAWKADLGNEYTRFSPAVDQLKVYAATMNGDVFALNKLNGGLLWKTNLQSQICTAPSVDNSVIFIGSLDGKINALRAQDGAIIWTYGLDSPATIGLAVSNDAVHAVSHSGQIYALSKSNGALLWKFKMDAPSYSAPAVIGDKLLSGANDKNLYALAVSNGALVSKTLLMAKVISPIALSRGKAVCLTDAGELSLFKSPNQPPAAPINLLVNHKQNPALNTPSVAFDWVLQDADAEDGQSIFQLQVAAQNKDFSAPVFDTGLVESTSSQYILTRLLPEGVYFWRSRTFDLFEDSGPFTSGENYFIWDRTVPETTLRLSGNLINDWYNTAVMIELAAADALSGVRQTNYRLERGGVLVSSGVYTSTITAGADGFYALYYYSADKAGNMETEKSVSFKIDRSLPQVSYTLVPAPNAAGWNNTMVQIAFNGTDALSGIAECSSKTVSMEGSSQQVAGWCRDVAGNTAYSTATLNIDLTRPIISASQVPLKNNYGWNNSSVTVTFTGTDTLSGIAYCTPAGMISGEGSNQAVSGYCQDYAGLSSTATLTLNMDKTAPLISAARSPAANAYGWANQSVSVAYTCSDNLSGVTACPSARVFTTEGLNISTTAVVYDYAGNITQVTTGGISIDLTKPLTTAGISGTLVNGWYNTAVSITLTPADTLAGLKQTSYRLEREGVLVRSGIYSSPIITSTDGLYNLYYYSTDKADNIETEKALSFKIDRTLPVVSYSLIPAPNAAGWNNTAVRVVFTGTDTLSGIAECSSIMVPTEGLAQTASGWCRDVAGNTAYSTATLNIDLTKPITSAAQTPAPNARGWNNTPVTVRFTGTDALSGVSYCAPDKLISAEGAGQNISGYCRDHADNSSAATLTLNIDRTAPVIGISSPAAGETFIATRGDIKIGFAVADNLDTAPAREAFLVQTEDRGSPRGNRPAIVAVTNGQSIEPLNIDDGMWRLTVSATDFADNAAYLAGGTFEVIHDVLPPRTAQTVSGAPQYTAGGTTYIRKDTELELSSIDDLVMVGDTIGLGVARQTLAIKTGDVPVRVLAFTNPKPEQGVIFVSTFTLDREADGLYYTYYYADDVLGNTETVRISSVAVDNTSPVAAHHIGSPYYAAGAANYIAPATSISFTAEDPVVNTVVSGLARIETASDGEQWQTYAQALQFTEGRHVIKYRSVDNLTNTEAEKTLEVQSDNTAPVSGFAASGQYYESAGRKYAPISFVYSLTANDPVVANVASGVRLSEYRIDGAAFNTYGSPFSLTEGIRRIEYRGYDNVSNAELLKSATVYIDNTAPATAYHIGGPYYAAGGAHYITPATPVTFTADDPITAEVASGVKRIEVSLDGGGYAVYSSTLYFPEGRHTVKYRAIDDVGNTEADRTLEVQSDNTAPASKWLAASGSRIEKDGRFYLNATGTITLESADPIVNNVASGVEGIYYGIAAAPFVKYAAPFGLAEGIRILNFGAKDNVSNTEVTKSTVIYADGTAPVSALSLSGDQYKGDRQYISRRTDIIITAEDPLTKDVAVGVKETKYAVDGGPYSDYAVFKLTTEGKRMVSYYSMDHVDNVEAVKKSDLWVDATPPATELTISGARYSPSGGDTIYITKDSGIVLTSTDPVSGDTASGLMMIKYRVDAGGWQLYQGSFTINAEGLHTVEFYGVDRVLNAETMVTANLDVDNTAPITAITLGEPKFEVFGLPILTPDAPVTLSAYDPVVNNVASGLNSIYYELEDAQTGVRAAVATYLEPFRLAQGAYIIRYWSKDNVANTETPGEIRVSVMRWREDGLAAVSGLDMSGTSDITGTVKSNAVVSVSGNARIAGDVTASTITLAGKAVITGLQTSGAQPLNPEPVYMPDISRRVAAVNDNHLIAPRYLPGGRLVLNSGSGLVLTTGTYYFKGMETAAGSSITIAGKVDILVDGGITISGGSSVNAGGRASSLNIFVAVSSAVHFTGGGEFLACVYAPYSQMKLAGNAVLGGHYFVKTAAVSGTGNYVQSGEILPPPAIVTADAGGKKKAAMETGLAGAKVLAGPDPAFKLNEVYVFPNPAKGGVKPVFHIEVGVADSVKITVYTVSGRVAHERTLSGPPITLDDGNGLDYAYEYTWDGHIPSGVYYYLVEAAKAGQKLKKTGKCIVVR